MKASKRDSRCAEPAATGVGSRTGPLILAIAVAPLSASCGRPIDDAGVTDGGEGDGDGDGGTDDFPECLAEDPEEAFFTSMDFIEGVEVVAGSTYCAADCEISAFESAEDHWGWSHEVLLVHMACANREDESAGNAFGEAVTLEIPTNAVGARIADLAIGSPLRVEFASRGSYDEDEGFEARAGRVWSGDELLAAWGNDELRPEDGQWNSAPLELPEDLLDLVPGGGPWFPFAGSFTYDVCPAKVFDIDDGCEEREGRIGVEMEDGALLLSGRVAEVTGTLGKFDARLRALKWTWHTSPECEMLPSDAVDHAYFTLWALAEDP